MTGEHLPRPERTRLTDTELIDQEIAIVEQVEGDITHPTARVIASQIHGGQATALYSFVSTGAIPADIRGEIGEAVREAQNDPDQLRRLEFLSDYIFRRKVNEDAGPVPGWAEMWIAQPGDEKFSTYCACCAEHISNPHGVTCPLGVDDEEQLTRVQALQAEHGTAILHWLNYLGFRSTEELERAAAAFPEHYYGFYPDLATFRRNYDIGPEEYIDQQYEIVEGFDGGVYIYDR